MLPASRLAPARASLGTVARAGDIARWPLLLVAAVGSAFAVWPLGGTRQRPLTAAAAAATGGLTTRRALHRRITAAAAIRPLSGALRRPPPVAAAVTAVGRVTRRASRCRSAAAAALPAMLMGPARRFTRLAVHLPR